MGEVEEICFGDETGTGASIAMRCGSILSRGPINRIELLQFTGLKDKNGKEIFEGDLVHVVWNDPIHRRETNGVVEWSKPERGRHGFVVEYISVGGFDELRNRKWTLEVVGNIYEGVESVSP